MKQVVTVNEHKSFMDFYDKYYKRIYNYIYRTFLNKEITEDLTSATFLNALNFMVKKNAEIEYAYTWLYKIATNEILTYYRKNKKVDFSHHDDVIKELEKSVDNTENLDTYMDFILIKEKMQELKENERVIINMHFFENRSYQEMADILDMKETTLRSKVHRILKKLKSLVHEEVPEPIFTFDSNLALAV